jgi:hypothetical protein
MKKIKFIISIIFLCSLASMAQKNTEQYKVIKTIPVTGDGSWDYLNADPAAGRLYISHGTSVQILDLKTEKLAGTIENTPGVHGIALVPMFRKGFISAGRMDSIIVFDMESLRVTGKIPAGQNPDAIIYDPLSKRVFAFNGKSHNVTVIIAKTNGIAGTIQLPGKPEYAVADGNGKMFVNIEDKGTIVKFDTKTLKIEAEWSLDPGKEPTGLAFDPVTGHLFSACSESAQMVVLNSGTGKVIATLPIGKGCDGCVFNPRTKEIISSNGEGTITVIRQENSDKYKVTQTLDTRKSARTITCDPFTGILYLSSAEVTMESGKRKIAPGTFAVIVVGK